jgi:hypothetical protein
MIEKTEEQLKIDRQTKKKYVKPDEKRKRMV